MGTAVLGADVIDKRQDIIGITVVVLESHLNLKAALLALEIEDRSQGFLVFIEIADKVFNPILIVELYFFASPRISQRQTDILKQEGRFLKSFRNGVVLEVCR